ncbi:MAG: YidH family protein [Burkholderiales bacterium]
MPDTHSSEQITLMRELVELSVQRSELSAERSYMNAERTLSVWIRTALSLMIFGIAIDRFGLMLREVSLPAIHGSTQSNALSMWSGLTLVALGVLVVLATGIRFLAYAVVYRRRHEWPARHGPYLALTFALLVTIFGIALLIILLAFT